MTKKLFRKLFFGVFFLATGYQTAFSQMKGIDVDVGYHVQPFDSLTSLGLDGGVHYYWTENMGAGFKIRYLQDTSSASTLYKTKDIENTFLLLFDYQLNGNFGESGLVLQPGLYYSMPGGSLTLTGTTEALAEISKESGYGASLGATYKHYLSEGFFLLGGAAVDVKAKASEIAFPSVRIIRDAPLILDLRVGLGGSF